MRLLAVGFGQNDRRMHGLPPTTMCSYVAAHLGAAEFFSTLPVNQGQGIP